MTLEKILEDNKIKPERLVKQARISKVLLYSIINGKRDPLSMPLKQAFLFAEALDIELDEFYKQLTA